MTVCDELVVVTICPENDKLLGLIVAIGAVGAAPVPVNVTVCGDPVALSVKVRTPLLVPVAVGKKVTFTVQDEEAAKLAPQLLVCEKSPLDAIEVIVRLAFPVFWSVTGSELLLTPTVVLGKDRLLGDIVAAGAGTAVPVPVNGID